MLLTASCGTKVLVDAVTSLSYKDATLKILKGMVYIYHSPKSMTALHRELIDCPKGLCVDHVNGNPLDNRMSNLRVCTLSENQHNQGRNSRNTSGFKGVDFHKGSWRARIKLRGVRKELGHFPTPELAYEAYCKAAEILHGEFRRVG